MINTSALWKQIVADGNFRTEARVTIGGVTYTEISAPDLSRGLMTDALELGNCISGCMQFSVRTTDAIAKSAEVVLEICVSNESAMSEWLVVGTYYIASRDEHKQGVKSFTCYDAMRRANRPYFTGGAGSSAWPMAMSDVVAYVSTETGIPIDSRTVIPTGTSYYVAYPLNLTMLEVLAGIAAVCGGNWCITSAGKLRLVPLVDPTDISVDHVAIKGILGNFSDSPAGTITKVSIEDMNGNEYSSGTGGGLHLRIGACAYASEAIASDLLTRYSGLVYQPFEATQAIYDPAAELGDIVEYGSSFRSVLYTENCKYDTAFRGDVATPSGTDDEDEYPYYGGYDPKLTQAVTEGLNAVDIGARNYIRHSNTLDFEGDSYAWMFVFNGDQATVNGANMEVLEHG